MESYRELVAGLARRYEEYTAEREEITSWYAHEQAAADAALDRAAEAVERATAEVAQARSLVERTDLEAHRLWLRLQDRSGRPGLPPEPALAAPANTDPARLLHEVAMKLEEAQRARRERRELPGWTSPALVVFGVLGAAVGYAVAYAARSAAPQIGGDIDAFAPVLRMIVTALAPLLGLVPAKLLADRTGGQLESGQIGTVLIAGLLTVAALLAAFH